MSPAGVLARGFVKLSMSEALIRILSVVALIMIARVLGPVALGQFAVAQAVVSYATAFSGAGVKALAQREMVSDPARAPDWATSAVGVQLTAAALFGGLIALMSPYLPFESGTQELVVVLSPLLVAQAASVQFVLQTRERFTALAMTRLVTQLAITGASLALLATGHSIFWMAVATWAGTLVGDVAALVFLGRSSRVLLRRPSWSILRQLISGSRSFLAITVLSLIIANADVIVVGIVRSPAEAGQYAVALRILTILIGISALVISVTFSQMVRLSPNPEALGAFADSAARWLCRFGYACASLIAFSAGDIIDLLFGEQFEAATAPLACLAIALPLGYCNTLLSQGLIAQGAQLTVLRTTAITAIFSLVSLSVVVPTGGITAAAVVVVAGEIVSLTGLTIASRKSWRRNIALQLLRQSAWFIIPGMFLAVARWASVSDLPPLLAIWLAALALTDGAVRFETSRRLWGVLREPVAQSPAP